MAALKTSLANHFVIVWYSQSAWLPEETFTCHVDDRVGERNGYFMEMSQLISATMATSELPST
jgi:hypothetical protein